MIEINILEVKHLCKSFSTHKVINDISFSISEHTVFGFIGKNGAGKTTTMKMILGFLKPDQGEIKILGKNVQYGKMETNRMIGYLPDVPEFYGYMTACEYLKLCGEITGMKSQELNFRIQKMIDLVGLSFDNKKISKYSRGMKQRLGIATAMLNEPKLLICDEPTSALDPIGRREVLDIFRTIKVDTTVLFSSHILHDVESVCESVALLDSGVLRIHGNIDDIRKRNCHNDIKIEFNTVEDRNRFMKLDEIKNVIKHTKMSDLSIVFSENKLFPLEEILIRCMIENAIFPNRYEKLGKSLEELFMEEVSREKRKRKE
jgi:ABC-2 type transport system ATP-binding protein